MTFTIDNSVLEKGAHEIMKDRLNYLDGQLDEFTKNALGQISKTDSESIKPFVKGLFELSDRVYGPVFTLISNYISTAEYDAKRLQMEEKYLKELRNEK